MIRASQLGSLVSRRSFSTRTTVPVVFDRDEHFGRGSLLLRAVAQCLAGASDRFVPLARFAVPRASLDSLRLRADAVQGVAFDSAAATCEAGRGRGAAQLSSALWIQLLSSPACSRLAVSPPAQCRATSRRAASAVLVVYSSSPLPCDRVLELCAQLGGGELWKLQALDSLEIAAHEKHPAVDRMAMASTSHPRSVLCCWMLPNLIFSRLSAPLHPPLIEDRFVRCSRLKGRFAAPEDEYAVLLFADLVDDARSEWTACSSRRSIGRQWHGCNWRLGGGTHLDHRHLFGSSRLRSAAVDPSFLLQSTAFAVPSCTRV